EHFAFVRAHVNAITAGVAHLSNDIQSLFIVLLVFSEGYRDFFNQVFYGFLHAVVMIFAPKVRN
ncbi:MAG TPA: hypothetical protein VEB40_04510, partial [Flavipsychrobacter sp.]|nr:hypothetical protein [Flavipsychrobacter sp.]